MEFVLTLDSLQCPHTIGSEQGQKAGNQENYRPWAGLEKWIPELTEISGQLPYSQLPFYL